TLYLISDEEIGLTPAEACIRAGDELVLSAELLGFAEGTSVQWQLLQGSGSLTPLPANGATRQAMFTTANEGSVVVQVSAQGVEDTIVDTASISVGTCDAKVHVSGQFAVQAAAGGERDEYELPED